MKLIIMRHSICEGLDKSIINGWNDYPLTKEGREEVVEIAKQLTELFGVKYIDKVYCSYLSRAQETAEILVTTLGNKVNIKQDLRLNERHYGDFQGMQREKAMEYKEYNTLSISAERLDNKLIEIDQEQYNKSIKEYENKLKLSEEELKKIIPKSESVIDVENRAKEFLENEIFLSENNDKTILVVSHANPVKLIVKQIEKLSYEDTVKLRFATCGMRIYDINITKNNISVLNKYNLNKEWKE